MLRSKSKANFGFGGSSNDKIQDVDDKENEKEVASKSLPASPSRSMRHKIKRSFSNLASLLNPKDTKSKSFSLAPTPEEDTRTAAIVPLPESPRSETPLSDNLSLQAKSASKSGMSSSLVQESNFKMDSKTAAMLLATARPVKGDNQKSDAGMKGKAPAGNHGEAKSLISIKKEIAGQAPTAPGPSMEHQSSADTTLPLAITAQSAGKENQPTTEQPTTPSKASDQGKGKAKAKRPIPRTLPPAGINRPPTPIPGSARSFSSSSDEDERQEGSDLTNQITTLLGRLSAGETIDYQLKNPEGYVDDDPECLDFLNDPECQELLGNTVSGASSAQSGRAKGPGTQGWKGRNKKNKK
ncbi:hypothetical protein TWF281_009960 [Arthrobotrys megalospora]